MVRLVILWKNKPKLGHSLEEQTQNNGRVHAPGRNRTSARGLGNRCQHGDVPSSGFAVEEEVNDTAWEPNG